MRYYKNIFDAVVVTMAEYHSYQVRKEFYLTFLSQI
jgi:hypothetical protein